MAHIFLLITIFLAPAFTLAYTVDTPSIYIQNPSAGIDVDVPGTSIDVNIPDVPTIEVPDIPSVTIPDIDVTVPRVDVPVPNLPEIAVPQERIEEQDSSLWEKLRSRRESREGEERSMTRENYGNQRINTDEKQLFFSRLRGFFARFFRRE